MGDQSLDLLISSLKTEAIEAAEKEAKTIIEEAKSKAETIINNAQYQKQQTITEADKEAEAILHKGKMALKQAARDLTINLQNDVLNLFNTALRTKVDKEFSPDLLKSLLLPLIKNIGSDIEVSMPANTLKELAEFIRNEVQKNSENITFKEAPHLFSGLKIFKKEEGWSFEITPDTLMEALKPLLTAHWVTLLNEDKK